MDPSRKPFRVLTGHTLEWVTGLEKGSDCIRFLTTEGKRFRLRYIPDCCATADIEDIAGGTEEDLVGQTVVWAETLDSQHEADAPPGHDTDSCTWSFYVIRTQDTTITIRWYGESNGYYSESATFEQLPDGYDDDDSAAAAAAEFTCRWHELRRKLDAEQKLDAERMLGGRKS